MGKVTRVIALTLLLVSAFWGLRIGVLTVMSCSGCAYMTPEAQLKVAVDSYTSTMRILINFRKAGLIGDEQALKIEEWRSIARSALNAWEEALEEGEPTDEYEAVFDRAIEKLTKLKIETEGENSACRDPASHAAAPACA